MPNIRRSNYKDLSDKVGESADSGFKSFVSKEEQQADSTNEYAGELKKAVQPEDRTDMSSNATSAFMRKRGY